MDVGELWERQTLGATEGRRQYRGGEGETDTL